MMETRVFNLWWEREGAAFERMGRDVEVNISSELLSMNRRDDGQKESNRGNLRIDAVCGVGAKVTLVEVKVVGNLTAVGQLIGYGVLFQRCYKGVDRIRLLLVAGKIPDTVKVVCAEIGIGTWEAPELDYLQIREDVGLSKRVASDSRVEKFSPLKDVSEKVIEGAVEFR